MSRSMHSNPDTARGSTEEPAPRSSAFGKQSREVHDKHPKRTGIRLNIRNVGEEPVVVDEFINPDDFEISEDFSSIHIRGVYARQNDILTVDLKIEANGTFSCTRCAEPAKRTLKTEIQIRFVPSSMVRDPDDDNVHVYDPIGYSYVDVTDDVRDALLLAIPMKILCRPDCKGICVGCGKDLNIEACICEKEGSNETWSALKDLKERLRAEEMNRPGK